MRKTLTVDSVEEARAVLGVGDVHARLLRDRFGVVVVDRNGAIQFEGDETPVSAALGVAQEVLARYRRSGQVDVREVEMLVHGGAPATAGTGVNVDQTILKTRSHRGVGARTPGQRRYVAAMNDNEVVFGIGPAGTGKTYLAVTMAVKMLREGVVRRIILTRPAVEAGEKLGFLPGDYEAKVNPYLRPLHDALYDLVEPSQIRKFAENDVIEVAPLAYMRGRTLTDAFIILDEAQNTTIAQMKMFLTRMGEGSRMVVTGDVTQVDLPARTESGLVHASRVLARVRGVAFVRFSAEDIVRHPVVQGIVDAYEVEQDREAPPEDAGARSSER